MKRVRAAFAVLILLAGFSIWGHFTVKVTTDTVESGLLRLQQAALAEQYDKADAIALELVDYCTQREELLTLFIKRDLVSSLRISLCGLQAYAKKENLADLMLELQRAQGQVHALHCQYYSMA